MQSCQHTSFLRVTDVWQYWYPRTAGPCGEGYMGGEECSAQKGMLNTNSVDC